jgi:nicotinamide riboside transporter PnuC
MELTIDTYANFGMFIFGVIAIILVAKKNKWGFVFGLCSQPFFFITSWINKQLGLFLLSIIYTMSWIYGIYIWFYKDVNFKSFNNLKDKSIKQTKTKSNKK